MKIPSQFEQRLRELGVEGDDVEERFIRGTGPGGQKINKTSSTVWLRHGPSGAEVRCQAGRSQTANRETAWTELCDKLEARSRKVASEKKSEREAERRRTRQKSRRQKARMVDDKKHRARQKATRGRVRNSDE